MLCVALAASTGCAPRVVGGSVSTLPEANLVTLAGAPTELGQATRGRIALLSLWATWCEACSKEFDALNRLSEGAASRADVVVVGIAVGEPRATVDAFVHRHGIHYPQLVDENFRLADALGQRDVPATLVIDRTGRIVYRGQALNREALRAFRRTLGDEP